MGTSDEAVMMDKLGRRSGPRRKYTIAEKRAMVEETHMRGASVPEVAQRHGVNANLLSVWRRLYRQGALVEDPPSSPALLPVTVDTAATKCVDAVTRLHVEVEFAGGQRLHLREVDRRMLKELIDALSTR